jgi:DNA-binding protein YbaB
MLEDLLLASLNEAMRKASETMESEMGKLTGGLSIPGMGGMF